VAAVGVAAGVHAYGLAVAGAVLALIVLEIFRLVERWVAARSGAILGDSDDD